jgi:hypothetical protein
VQRAGARLQRDLDGGRQVGGAQIDDGRRGGVGRAAARLRQAGDADEPLGVKHQDVRRFGRVLVLDQSPSPRARR